MNTTDKNAFGFLINDVTRFLRKQFDRRAVRFDLTRAQWRALKRISHNEGLSQTELAEELDMEPIAVGRVIDRLQKAGFVERRADPADRRTWRLHLTQRAHAVVGDMEKIANQLFKEAQRGITAAEMKSLLSTLGMMKQNLVAMDDIEKRP